MENKHGGSGFMNGLVIGIIIGAALVFFLGTKKGKELLKTITEEGLEDISEFGDYVGSQMDDEEEQSYAQAPEEGEEASTRMPRQVKRFFRGVKRG